MGIFNVRVWIYVHTHEIIITIKVINIINYLQKFPAVLCFFVSVVRILNIRSTLLTNFKCMILKC